MPTLREALTGLAATVHGSNDVVVTGVSADSRTIRPGDIFVAMRGLADDGHRYIADAVTRGARAIVSEQARLPASSIPWVTVPNAPAALGWLAAYFQGFPGRHLRMIGVTGTDGKTTTSSLIAHILDAAGWSAGLVSTVQLRLGSAIRPNTTSHTTPPAPVLQTLLAEMAQSGLRWVVLEVSSHALAQMRVAGCFFDVGVFTNLTPEHLNYHGDFERYRQAKAQLFAMLGREPKAGVPSFGVFNADDPSSDSLRAVCAAAQITYGIERKADYHVSRLQLGEAGTKVYLDTPHGHLEVWTPLPGRFNVYNVVAASAVALRLGIPAETVIDALHEFPGVPGRLQRVNLGQPFQVFVDFAHTPNGLNAVLTTLRPWTVGRLLLVFGHPGGRDLQNRRVMARVAAAGADLVVLTSDDPYDEDPRAILDQIESEIRGAGCCPNRDFLRIDDRTAAIATALRLAQPGDSILIAGRGHLEYTVIRGQKRPFSDVEVARRQLQALRVPLGI